MITLPIIVALDSFTADFANRVKSEKMLDLRGLATAVQAVGDKFLDSHEDPHPYTVRQLAIEVAARAFIFAALVERGHHYKPFLQKFRLIPAVKANYDCRHCKHNVAIGAACWQVVEPEKNKVTHRLCNRCYEDITKFIKGLEEK
jgi:hypothetical protein